MFDRVIPCFNRFGTPRETAVDLAGRILDSVLGNLLKLSDLELSDFCRFAGMGVAKTCSILAAMKLAKRMYPMVNVVPVKKVQVPVVLAFIRQLIDSFFLFGKVLWCFYIPAAPLFNRSLFELGLHFIGWFPECVKGLAWLKVDDEETLFKKKGKKGKRN